MSSASFAYPRHSGEARAEVARRLRGRQADEGFLLATCLRFELTVPGDPAALEASLGSVLGDLSGLEPPEVRVGEDAVVHLFRVAAGLESPILGEAEILTQFRQALITAEETGAVVGRFAGLLESAVSVGRKARDLLPGSPHSSLAAVAAQVTGAVEEVAVLGYGIMGAAAVEVLLQLPAPPKVTVVARNPEKVGVRDRAQVWPFTRAEEALSSFPAVISATSAKRRLVDRATMREALWNRKEPLVLVDMAMPPDFDPPGTEKVAYYGIDDLARIAERRPRAVEADSMVREAAADAYLLLHHHQEVAPLIGALLRRADQVVEGVVDRFQGRLGGGNDPAVLRQTAHTVARTLLAGPVAYVKGSPEAVEVIAEAFGVEDE